MSTAATSKVPKLHWRLVLLLGLWHLIFGVIIAFTPLHLEGGVDVTQEKLKFILMAPVLGWLGLGVLISGGPRFGVGMILAFMIILGAAIGLLFRCRTLRAFWTLAGVNAIVIAGAGVGFSQFIQTEG